MAFCGARSGEYSQCAENELCFSKYPSSDHRQFTEKRTTLLIRLLLYICILISSVSAQNVNCDFSGSGLDVEGTGVQPVYLSCSSGKVQWDYPRGGLRIVLNLPHSTGQFRACIKLSHPVKGARMFLEGHRTLLPIDMDRKRGTRCFSSYKSRVALYIEATPGNSLQKVGASFAYNLQPFDGEIYDPSDECKPCKTNELVHHYCSSDFVARGHFIDEKEDNEMTILTFSAKKVYQQTTPIFSNHSNTSKMLGHIQVPSHCRAHIGPGQFLVMGYLRLGDPLLKCAIEIDQWKSIVKSAQTYSHCILET